MKGEIERHGLPYDFSHFMKKLSEFTNYYGIGEIFSTSENMSLKSRLHDTYIYCSVVFNGGDMTYYYLTDDESIKVGDFVVVPVGYDNVETIVKVVKMEICKSKNVPYTLKNMKRVIRKYK